MAKYGLTVVAPTPIKTANECVSRTSELSTFIEQYPLKPNFTRCEWTAPTAKMEGILAWVKLIFLSDNIKLLLPSRTAISASSLIFSILSFRDKLILKVQSSILIFF